MLNVVCADRIQVSPYGLLDWHRKSIALTCQIVQMTEQRLSNYNVKTQ